MVEESDSRWEFGMCVAACDGSRGGVVRKAGVR